MRSLNLRNLAAGLVAALAASGGAAAAQDLYRFQSGSEPRWHSPENRTGAKGAGGQENKGAKGRAWDTISAGETYVLAEAQGPGIVDRMWITLNDRSPERLRQLRFEVYYDGARTPAVSVPFGDFFAHGVGDMRPMETSLFASPEGRSFVATVPMPFRRSIRMQVVNESAEDLTHIFYDVNLRKLAALPKDALYFHAWWSRDRATKPGQAFKVLPRIQGRGRFLGMSVGLQTNPAYEKTWWGEGEVKIRLDGDRAWPTLVGTGTEDYIGSAWSQGEYVNLNQGAPVGDEATGRWAFYRFHVPDPIFFEREIEVELPQMGGSGKKDVMRLQQQGAPLIPVTMDTGTRKGGFISLLEGAQPRPLADPTLPADGWVNFYRSDDVAAVAYFYLDRPENGLPALPPAAERAAALRKPLPPPEKK
jgi:hypothetical protein